MVVAVLTAADVPSLQLGCEALPIATTPSGMLVAIPQELAVDVPDGTHVDVMVDVGHAAFRAEAVVRQQEPTDDALELVLDWADLERVRMRMPGAVQEALLAMHVRYGQPVRASLPKGGEWIGRLLDLTGHSVTISVPAGDAPAVGDSVPVQLHLGDSRPVAEPRARTVSVRPCLDGDVAVTLSFVGADAPLARLSDRIQQVLAGRRSRRTAMR